MRRIGRARDFGPRLYGFGEEKATGRSCMLLSALLSSVITWLSGGMFYTSFLMVNGINIVNVGIISFVPFIANCFAIFSPSILERFQRRKAVLAWSRAAYYTLSILAITLLPEAVQEPELRLVLFVAVTFAANIINALFTSGYSVWHVNFIPDQVRARYFSSSQLVTAFAGQGAALLSSFLADALAGSAYQNTIIVVFRYAAYALGLLDVYFLTRPVEYPYSHSAARPRFRDIFAKPLRHRPFAVVMALIFAWNFSANLPAGALNYYLIDSVGASYTFVYLINMVYPFTILLLMRPAQRMVRQEGWLKTFAWTAMLTAPTNMLYAFVTAGTYLWLMPVVRILQHILGVGLNLAYANLPYIHLPREDQTNYMSFHILTVNIGAFLGMMLGTWFVGITQGWQLTILGTGLSGVQILLFAQGVGQWAIGLAILPMLRWLEPRDSL